MNWMLFGQPTSSKITWRMQHWNGQQGRSQRQHRQERERQESSGEPCYKDYYEMWCFANLTLMRSPVVRHENILRRADICSAWKHTDKQIGSLRSRIGRLRLLVTFTGTRYLE